jgi:soluble lytic murein transglycosylase-like protein
MRRMPLAMLILCSALLLGGDPEPLPTPLPPEVEVSIPAQRTLPTGLRHQRLEELAKESLTQALCAEGRLPKEAAQAVTNAVLDQAASSGLDHSLLMAVLVVESRGNYRASSPAGALGLMQIMPGTGRFIARHLAEPWKGKRTLFEVERNIRYGAWYLGYLRETFSQEAYLAAYNWGPGRIRHRLKEGRGIPSAYPRQVSAAQKRIKERTYEFYQLHYWRSLDLSREPPRFRECPS